MRLSVLSILFGVSFGISATAQENASASAFEGVAEVLRHPRCLNCHQVDVPLQKAGRRHVPLVTRGVDNHGTAVLRCGNCHSTKGNNAYSGAPGAPHWQLAPASMNWSGLSVPELCTMLKDPERNGGRDGEALLEHMGPHGDPLVLWGWAPGGDREPIPVAHEDFIGLLEVWVEGGMACPE